MSDTITIHQIEILPNGRTSLQVISMKDTLEGDRFFVRLSEADEHEDTPFEDYPQAYAHWRNVLLTLGITVKYQAPLGITVSFAEDEAVRGPTEVYYELHGQLSRFSPGTPEATAVRDAFMKDPVFRENAAEIMSLAGDSAADWKAAVIRTACRRVLRELQTEAQTVIEQRLGSVEGFGAF